MATVKLPKLYLSDGYIGDTIQISIIGLLQFSHNYTISYEFQGTSGTIATHSKKRVYDWTIPTSFYELMPNSKSEDATFTLTIYDSDNNVVGTNDTIYNIATNQELCIPTILGRITDDNSTFVHNVTGSIYTLVSGLSDFKVTMYPYPKNSATIVSNYIEIVATGERFEGDTHIFEKYVDIPEFKCITVDSRGYSNETIVTPATYKEYYPSKWDLDFGLMDGNGNMDISINGEYWKDSFGLVSNTIQAIRIEFTSNPEGDSRAFTVFPTLSEQDNTFTFSQTLTGLDYTKTNYDFVVTVTESANVIVAPVVSKYVKPLFDWGESDFNFNCDINVYENPLIDYLKPYLLDAVYPVGSIYMSTENVSPETFLGGTWEQITDTFLLAAGSKYLAGDTGGEETVTLTVDEIPEHGHKTLYYSTATGDYNWGYNYTNATKKGKFSVSDAEDNSGIGHTGGGQPHNNMPPYQVVYMWQRIGE